MHLLGRFLVLGCSGFRTGRRCLPYEISVSLEPPLGGGGGSKTVQNRTVLTRQTQREVERVFFGLVGVWDRVRLRPL